MLRGEAILELPSPVYQQPQPPADDSADALITHEQLQADAISKAVETIAEMELTAEELRAAIKVLKNKNVAAVVRSETGKLDITTRALDMAAGLLERFENELPALPFATRSAAQAAFDTRNSRFRASQSNWAANIDTDGEEGGISSSPSSSASSSSSSSSLSGPGGAAGGLGQRLEKAERVAEQFVSQQLQPAVKRVRENPEGVLNALKGSAVWAGGLWDRLNGKAASYGGAAAPSNLPSLSGTTEEQRQETIAALSMSIDELEKKLQEASKARENRLRKAGIQGRARLAGELRTMDNEVATVSRALAVRTLQLEMEYIYGALEEEARDVLGDSRGNRALALSRRGSTDEVALLAAEFKQLDSGLSALAAAVDTGEGLFDQDEAELARLATDIPDMRMRLGLGDTEVFGGSGFSVVKLQLQVKTTTGKVREGVAFGVRGVRLLASDIGSAGGLFWRAVRGGTLKPREVQALRRTARDMLTFIPFTIILILPLTPVGHVLVFGFLQRYFPGFFPSQFTNRRQELMLKYEGLKQQLEEARARAELEEDEMQFARDAAAAAARLEMDRQQQQADATAAAGVISSSSPMDEAVTVPLADNNNGSINNGGGGGVKAVAVGSGAHDGGSDDNDSKNISEEHSVKENGRSSSNSSSKSSDGGTVGPAAAALKQLEEQVAAAADSSYCEDGSSESNSEH
jgi:hypothetical protein